MIARFVNPGVPLTVLLAVMLGFGAAQLGAKMLVVTLGAPIVALLLMRPQWCLWLIVASIPVTIDFGSGLTVTRVVVPLVAAGILCNAMMRRCPWPNPVGNPAALAGTLVFIAIGASLAVVMLTQQTPIDTVRLNKELSGYATRMALFFATLTLVRRPEDVRNVTLLLVIIGAIEALTVIAQVHFHLVLPGEWRFSAINNVDETTGVFRAEGTTPHPIYLAGYLQMVLPFAVLVTLRARMLVRLLAAASVVLMLYAWYSAFSRSSLIGIAVMVATALCIWSRIGRTIVVGGAVLFVLALSAHGWSLPDLVQSIEQIRHFGQDVRSDQLTSGAGSLQFRLESSAGAFNLFLAHPLAGVGIGQGIHEYMKYLPSWATSPFHPEVIHNAFLEVAAETGILGLGALIALWVFAFRGVIAAWNEPDLSDYARVLLVVLVGQAVFLSLTPMVRDIWFTLPLGAALGHIMRAKALERHAGIAVSSAQHAPS